MEQGEVFRLLRKGELNAGQQVSIPLEQGGVFRPIESTSRTTVAGLSQSLWNRAGSFDTGVASSVDSVAVSIPLEQGRVFRHTTQIAIQQALRVSIPLEQGRVFRLFEPKNTV